MPEMWTQIGEVTLLAAEDIETGLAAAAQRHQVVLIPQVGVLVWDNSLETVADRAEALEYISQLTLIAQQTREDG
jgi:ribulose-5-phosphate 4-epimerase/fuculose-1-phosphate aldolase